MVCLRIPSVTVHSDNVSIPGDVPQDLAFKMVGEHKDRERQKLNLIFYKVPESQAKESASRVANDIKSILETTKEIARSWPCRGC